MYKCWTEKEIEDEILKLHEKFLPCKSIKVEIKPKMVSTYGTCLIRNIGKPNVSVEYTFTGAFCKGIAKEEDVIDTIRHEFAHFYANQTAKKHVGHSSKWKEACLLVGAKPERCSLKLPDDYGMSWKIVCTKCRKSYYKSRLSYGLDYHKEYYISNCCDSPLEFYKKQKDGSFKLV